MSRPGLASREPRLASSGARARYSGLASYYATDRARRVSRHVDYGVCWLDRPARGGVRPPPWRVTYVSGRWEVITTPLSGDGPVRVLAVVMPLPYPAGDVAAVDRLLAGWDNPVVTGWQLSWVCRRLAPGRL